MSGQGPTGPTWERLEDQIAWYDRKSAVGQRWYKRIKVAMLVAAALIPLAATQKLELWVPAVLGSLIVVLEGIQAVYRHHENWITYRSTCEALRHERFLFLARAGPYASAANPTALLAERVEGLVSQEHAKWASTQEEARRQASPPAEPAG